MERTKEEKKKKSILCYEIRPNRYLKSIIVNHSVKVFFRFDKTRRFLLFLVTSHQDDVRLYFVFF